jgi:hypothetical protein
MTTGCTSPTLSTILESPPAQSNVASSHAGLKSTPSGQLAREAAKITGFPIARYMPVVNVWNLLSIPIVSSGNRDKLEKTWMSRASEE